MLRAGVTSLVRFAVACLALCALPALTRAADLTYLVHAPTQASPHPPLIVLLHGAGADERDMVSMWRELPPTFVVISPRAPFGGGSGYRWYRKDGARPKPSDLDISRKIVDLVVDSAVKRFDADPSRIYIGGFSQGGVLTYEVALREPTRFRGAVVLSGSLFADAAAAARASAPPFFIAHGTADARIPFAAATAARDTLAKRSIATSFHAYPGMGHETRAAELADLRAWLER